MLDQQEKVLFRRLAAFGGTFGLEAAVRSLERGVRPHADGSIDWTGVRCLPGLVGALRRLGRWETATKRAEEGVELAEQFCSLYELSQLLDELARLAAPTDPVKARDLVHRSLALRRDYGLRTCLPDSLEALAELDAAEAVHLARAVRLLGACQAARERMGYPRPRVDAAAYDRLLATLRGELAEDFDEQWAAGAAIPICRSPGWSIGGWWSIPAVSACRTGVPAESAYPHRQEGADFYLRSTSSHASALTTIRGASAKR